MSEEPQPVGVLGGLDAYRDYLSPDEPEPVSAPDESGQLSLWEDPAADEPVIKRMAA
jgi:hypothetical protein